MSSEALGGSLFVDSETNSSLSIIDSKFSECFSRDGGAVYIENSSVSFKNVTFSRNTAKSGQEGKGGAVYVAQSSSAKIVQITDSKFEHNLAGNSGGGIQWFFKQPTLSNNNYLNNSAGYGPDIGSFAMNMSLRSSRSLESLTFVPGQVFTLSLELNLIDHYNQTVTNDNSSTAQLETSKDSNWSITGLSKSISSKGVLTFTGFTVFGPPGESSSLNIIPNFQVSSNNFASSTNLQILLRECIVGESNLENNRCKGCEPGTYNLKAGSTCKECPKGGKCFGHNKIVAASGYWRYSKTTDTFIECPNPSSCLEENYGSSGDNCKTGYHDNCCQSCDPNYSRSFQDTCSECLDPDRNVALLTGLIVVVILFVVSITTSNIKGASKDESVTSIYYKILMNYFQIIILAVSIDMSWPSYVKKMFEVQGKVVGGYEQLISIDCFLQSKMEPIYAKLIIFSLIPVICLIFSGLFWTLWAKLKNPENFKARFLGSFIVQFFFFQPYLAELIIIFFNCSELAPGELYLTEEMSIRCWSGQHLRFTLAIALPSMIIWCIGLPAVLLVFLNKNRLNLDDISEKLKYGFLYKGFKPSQFYWEFVIMVKKTLIILATVFLRKVSVAVQGLVVFIIIIAGYILQLKLQPYTLKRLNIMELRAIIVSAVTIYAGLFFITGEISNEGKVMIFVLMIFSNVAFLAYWFYFTFGYYLGTVYVKLLCCKKLFKGKLDAWVTKVVPDTSGEQAIKVDTCNKEDLHDFSLYKNPQESELDFRVHD